MHLEVRAFARAREILGVGHIALDLPDGACVRDAWEALIERNSSLSNLSGTIRIALNSRVADAVDVLADGDELALLPPVGGG